MLRSHRLYLLIRLRAPLPPLPTHPDHARHPRVSAGFPNGFGGGVFVSLYSDNGIVNAVSISGQDLLLVNNTGGS